MERNRKAQYLKNMKNIIIKNANDRGWELPIYDENGNRRDESRQMNITDLNNIKGTFLTF